MIRNLLEPLLSPIYVKHLCSKELVSGSNSAQAYACAAFLGLRYLGRPKDTFGDVSYFYIVSGLQIEHYYEKTSISFLSKKVKYI